MKFTAALLSLTLILSGQFSFAQEASDPCGKLAGYNIGIQKMNQVISSGARPADNEFAISVILISSYVSNLKADKAQLRASQPGQSGATIKRLQGEIRALRESAQKECNARENL